MRHAFADPLDDVYLHTGKGVSLVALLRIKHELMNIDCCLLEIMRRHDGTMGSGLTSQTPTATGGRSPPRGG